MRGPIGGLVVGQARPVRRADLAQPRPRGGQDVRHAERAPDLDQLAAGDDDLPAAARGAQAQHDRRGVVVHDDERVAGEQAGHQRLEVVQTAAAPALARGRTRDRRRNWPRLATRAAASGERIERPRLVWHDHAGRVDHQRVATGPASSAARAATARAMAETRRPSARTARSRQLAGRDLAAAGGPACSRSRSRDQFACRTVGSGPPTGRDLQQPRDGREALQSSRSRRVTLRIRSGFLHRPALAFNLVMVGSPSARESSHEIRADAQTVPATSRRISHRLEVGHPATQGPVRHVLRRRADARALRAAGRARDASSRAHATRRIRKYAHRFHLNTLVSRFNSLSELWGKTIRSQEEGDRPAPAMADRDRPREQLVARCRFHDASPTRPSLRRLYERFVETRERLRRPGNASFPTRNSSSASPIRPRGCRKSQGALKLNCAWSFTTTRS